MAGDVKKQIQDAFLRHASREGMDKVTVHALVTECQISRQAFYYHYQDLVDVARQALKQELAVTLDVLEGKTPREAADYIARSLSDHFPLIAAGIGSKYRREMELILIEELKGFFQQIFFTLDQPRRLSRRQLLFSSDILACGMTGYAVEHCNDVGFDQEAFAQNLWEMVEEMCRE